MSAEAKVCAAIREHLPGLPEADAKRTAKWIAAVHRIGENQTAARDVRRSLSRVERACEALAAEIERLPRDAGALLAPGLEAERLASVNWLANAEPRAILAREAKRITGVVRSAEKKIEPRRGRPGGHTALIIAEICADMYERGTNKRAAPGYDAYTEQRGPYEHLLADVFHALGLNASPEWAAKQLARGRKT